MKNPVKQDDFTLFETDVMKIKFPQPLTSLTNQNSNVLLAGNFHPTLGQSMVNSPIKRPGRNLGQTRSIAATSGLRTMNMGNIAKTMVSPDLNQPPMTQLQDNQTYTNMTPSIADLAIKPQFTSNGSTRSFNNNMSIDSKAQVIGQSPLRAPKPGPFKLTPFTTLIGKGPLATEKHNLSQSLN